jgi:N-acetyl-gamma-glutamyl-phosphate reductase
MLLQPAGTLVCCWIPMTSEAPAVAPAARPRVAIAGATGYAGQELVRLLARHPAVRLTMATSSGADREPRPMPALTGIWDGEAVPLDVDRLAGEADVVFLALPDTASATLAPALLARGRRVIDLSGAFRLRDDAARDRWYPGVGALPDGTAYGLPERNAAAVRDARLVSNPGCYPTAAVLALAPLTDAGLLDGPVAIDAKSGVSGAGKKPSERTHFAEVDDSLSTYGVFSHRHAPEIEQGVGGPVTFVAHLLPITRGILETIYAPLKAGVTAATLAGAYADAYTGAPFVRLRGDALPEIKHVTHTNFCDVGWRVDESRRQLVLVSVIDNLVKGAAGQAVQNLNVLLGLDERTGLL